ncbi:MAG: hypothetical protein IT310_01585 [Anaerolineales bacterium]|nr:hypothetical protein [Anaerolineales bacterium]
MAINILLLILILLRVVIGLRLFALARQNNLPNLNWLGLYFILFAFGAIFAPVQGNPLGNLSASLLLLTVFGVLLTQSMLIVFNHGTFYQDRNSPIMEYWIIFAITGVATLYGVFISESNFNQSPWAAAYLPTQLLVWGWHAWAAYQALQELKREMAVEDWIKSRYRLMIWYSALVMIGGVASIIRTLLAGGVTTNQLGSFMGLLTLLMQIASVALQFLVWVMPESFRQWLNRDQKEHAAERLHEQAQAVLNIVGDAMAEVMGMSKMLALFSIRKVIGLQINTEEAAQVEAKALSMDFNQWMELLNHPELYNLIKNSGPNVVPSEVINRARQALIDKQSFFTMKAT